MADLSSTARYLPPQSRDGSTSAPFVSRASAVRRVAAKYLNVDVVADDQLSTGAPLQSLESRVSQLPPPHQPGEESLESRVSQLPPPAPPPYRAHPRPKSARNANDRWADYYAANPHLVAEHSAPSLKKSGKTKYESRVGGGIVQPRRVFSQLGRVAEDQESFNRSGDLDEAVPRASPAAASSYALNAAARPFVSSTPLFVAPLSHAMLWQHDRRQQGEPQCCHAAADDDAESEASYFSHRWLPQGML